jgi:glycosyltransferase TcdB-like subunit of Tc toxinin
LDLRSDSLRPDPRIAHTLNLQVDEYANVLQSVAVVYPRLGQFVDNTLKADELTLIRNVQRERHLAYTETRYTEDFGTQPTDKLAALDNYRLRLPREVLTYELTGVGPADADDIISTDPRDNLYFTFDELRAFRLSQVHQKSGTQVPDSPYHKLLNSTTLGKRLVEHARTLFVKENLVDPLPFGEHGRLGSLTKSTNWR